MKLLLVLAVGLATVVLAQPVIGMAGVVIDAGTHEPIAGATVCCYVSNAQTGPDGHYLISELAPGRYRVRAIMTGYETAYYPESVEVIHGQVTEDVNFEMVRTGAQYGCISGWVFDVQTRLPIVGATVCSGAGNDQTDETGYYVITELEPRRYEVRAMATGYETAVYPESVEVTAGHMTGDINFCLEPVAQTPGAIWGNVTCAVGGATIVGAVVRATNPEVSRCVAQCSTGYRLCQLPPGRYWVSATSPGFEPGHYPESVEVITGQITDHIDFELEPTGGQTGGISGFVTNAHNGGPIMGALVVAEGPGRGQANTCQRGGYTIHELPPGVYFARATAQGFEPSALETVDVTAGHVTPNVDFALVPLSGGTGAVTGWVHDSLSGGGINDAEIVAWGHAGQGSTMSESCGGHILRELRAGPYVVRACARGYYHKLFPDSVCVASGETTRNINFLLRPVQGQAGGVSGFVFDATAQAEIPGANVVVIGTGGTWEATSDANGDYLVDGLEPGDYQIEAEAPGYARASYPGTVTVETGVITAFVSPALFPLAGIAQARTPEPRLYLTATPNPFRTRTVLCLPSAGAGPGTVRICDRTGRTVRALDTRSGVTQVIWDGRDDSGRSVAEGIYFVRVEGTAPATAKLVLVSR